MTDTRVVVLVGSLRADSLNRRINKSYYFDPGDVFLDRLLEGVEILISDSCP